jgi:hypothetical protein
MTQGGPEFITTAMDYNAEMEPHKHRVSEFLTMATESFCSFDLEEESISVSFMSWLLALQTPLKKQSSTSLH